MRTPRRHDGYAPIQDYAVIGSKRSAALVDTNVLETTFETRDRDEVLDPLLATPYHRPLAPLRPRNARSRTRPDPRLPR